MPGTKGHSGGKREGAGPPVKNFTIRLGQKYATWQHFPDGQLPGRRATVVEVSRSKCIIEFDDGERLTLIR